MDDPSRPPRQPSSGSPLWPPQEPWERDDQWRAPRPWQRLGRQQPPDAPGPWDLPTTRMPRLPRRPASDAPEVYDAPTRRLPTMRAARAALKQPPRRKLPALLMTILLLTCLITSSVGAVAYGPQLLHDRALLQDAMQQLKTAETAFKALAHSPLDSPSATSARQALAAANRDFIQLNADVRTLPGIAVAIPKYGALLTAGQHLLPLAITATQAGTIACDALILVISRLKNPLDTTAKGLTAADMTVLQQDVAAVVALFNQAVAQLGQLSPSDLRADPRLGPAVALFRGNLPRIQQGIQTLQTLLTVAPGLLGIGTPTSYLIEQMDSTEIRPGGGFIGNIGVATVSGGRLQGIKMEDVDLIDAPYKYGPYVIPIPAVYSWYTLVPRWGLRDSNLDADFPASARNAEYLYHLEGGTADVQGVVAITPWLILNALKITGPIDVTEYHETITADNLIERIHYHQLLAAEGGDNVPDPTGHSSLRKRFTSYLFDHFMARVKQLAGTAAMSQLIHLAIDSIRTKDIQVYLNSTTAEKLLQQYHLGSTIEAPPAGDSLLVVDANVVADKANGFMTYDMNDQVTIDASGNAVHHTTLTYTWPQSALAFSSHYAYGSTLYYLDYLRVYVPPNSVLRAQDGWVAQSTSQAFGREVFAGKVWVWYGTSQTVSLTWSVPHAATHDATGWHYQYLVQRQAGLTWGGTIQVTLPACAALAGTNDLTFIGARGILLNPYLTRDLTSTVDYTCPQ